jgi:DUF1365 family protein
MLMVSGSCLYEGHVIHNRLAGGGNSFCYGVYLWLVDLDELPELDRRLGLFGNDRAALTSIRSRDHLGDPARSIKQNLLSYLTQEGVDLEGGQVVLLTNARVLGHVFNPLSLFYCHGPDARLRCIVAEVHNTYGQRHCYLLRPGADADRYEADKAFYVSPFLTVEGRYRMRITEPGERIAVRMQLEQQGQVVFRAALDGLRRPLDGPTLRRMLLRHPLMPGQVSARIRLQGLRLWARGAERVPRLRGQAG